MKKILLIASVLVIVILSIFYFYKKTSDKNIVEPIPVGQVSSIDKSASDNCVKQGGFLKTEKRGDGVEYNLCYFEDNRACEEWALMKGECPIGGRRTTGFDDIDQKYCAWLGGSTLATENSVCEFKNGSSCKTLDLYNGRCLLPDANNVAIENGKYCFSYSQKATATEPYSVSEDVVLNINNLIVTGTKKGTQSGPDMTNGYYGDLKGSVKSNNLEVTYSYTIEGSKNKELELYEFKNDSLVKMRWPLVEKNNILVPDKTGELKMIIYKKIDCK